MAIMAVKPKRIRINAQPIPKGASALIPTPARK